MGDNFQTTVNGSVNGVKDIENHLNTVKQTHLPYQNGENSYSSKSVGEEDMYLENAKTNSIKRFLSCAANEGCVAIYFLQARSGVQYAAIFQKSTHQLEESFWVVLKERPILGNSDPNGSEEETTKNIKILENLIHWRVGGIRRITYFHPDDIALPVYEYKKERSNGYVDEEHLSRVHDLLHVVKRILEWNEFNSNDISLLLSEIQNSILNQAAAYKKGWSVPQIGDKNIKWEQSVMEGHPTHPTNKARFAVFPVSPVSIGADLYHIKMYFFALPRDQVTIRGTYEKLLRPFLITKSANYNPETEIVIPVHEIQLPNIYKRFPLARKLDICVPAEGTLSIRTVWIPEIPQLNFKVPIGVKIGTIERTVPLKSTRSNIRLLEIFPKILDQSSSLLRVARDLGSVIVKDSDEASQHFSCIIREDPESLVEENVEFVIVCAALTERRPDGVSVLASIFKLDTDKKKKDFMESYISTFIKAFFPPLINYGVAFDPHLQNVVAIFRRTEDGTTWKLVGFIVRDMESLRIHVPTILTTAGINLNDDESGDFDTDLNAVATRIMYSAIQQHLHGIIRALDFHYNGLGWIYVRQELDKILPKDSYLRQPLLESEFSVAKCYIHMKVHGTKGKIFRSNVANLVTCTCTTLNGYLNSS